MTTMRTRPIGDVWTTADLEQLPPTVRAEVHNGKLVIMSPARLWHQHIQSLIRNILGAAGRHAFTEVGVERAAHDTRVADIAVFHHEPTDPDSAWHDPSAIALVVEVWSPSSDGKDRSPDWYADLGIAEYWLAEPIEGEKWGAMITMYELARTSAGRTAYIETRRTTLEELQRSGR